MLAIWDDVRPVGQTSDGTLPGPLESWVSANMKHCLGDQNNHSDKECLVIRDDQSRLCLWFTCLRSHDNLPWFAELESNGHPNTCSSRYGGRIPFSEFKTEYDSHLI